ncbi:hypothetical protein O1611_g3720 [Lasiodiplodia mahajangana]|uniref:Uncharacterized protein n=1 Tax=Lasiodiplodia mahajangana TaxID=1108764 RepID=A0ACC2JRM2_9PEZI|nr:hypothetical protein O1611_g3720 [Lasiodiplodia mahajangana]
MAATYNLEKGSVYDLGKTLSEVTVGLDWDANKDATSQSTQFDLDVYTLPKMGDVYSELVFWGSKKSKCGSVCLSNDSQTGDDPTSESQAGKGKDDQSDHDDEQVDIKLNNLPTEITSLDVFVMIHDGEALGQNFSQVGGARFRLFNSNEGPKNGTLFKFAMSGEGEDTRNILAGTFFREDDSWKFKRVEQNGKFDQKSFKDQFKWVDGYDLKIGEKN